MELVLGLLLGLATGTMLDPRVDEGPRFEYFAATAAWLPQWPTTGQPVPRRGTGLRVTGEGHLAGLSGSLVLLAGEPLSPVYSRVKTWSEGGLPIVVWEDRRDGVTLRCQAMATSGEAPAGLLRVSLRAGERAVRLPVAIGLRPDAGLPVVWPLNDPADTYALVDGAVQRNGRLLCAYPRAPAPRYLARLGREYTGPFGLGAVGGGRAAILALAQYTVPVGARQTASLVFRLSQDPTAAEQLPALRRLDFDEAALRERERWTALLDTAPALELPETKAAEAYRWALMRLRTWGQADLAPWPALSPEDERRLLAAATDRGLVVCRAAGDHVLSPYWTAARASLHLARDEPALAVAGLYAMLLHSSATHEFSDAVPVAWSERERLGAWGLPLDPRPATAYVRLVQEMLARTTGDRLRLLTALPPAWVPSAGRARAGRVPTSLGPVALSWTWRDGAVVVSLESVPAAPGGVVMRLPWWLAGGQASVDGRPVALAGGWLTVPSGARVVELRGAAELPPASPSYAAAVAAYRGAYRERAAGYAAAGGVYAPERPPLGEDDFATEEADGED